MAARLTYLDVGSADLPLLEAARNGDRAVFATWPGGTLVAVIDGLGHGGDAADASDAAAIVLAVDPGAPLVELVARCHAALHRTRGAVMTVVTIAPNGALAWLGVGNVAGVLRRAPGNGDDETLAPRGGTVGFHLPHLEARRFQLAFGDAVVLASDGVRPRFREDIVPGRSASALAHDILARHAIETDDACVAVARFVGAHA